MGNTKLIEEYKSQIDSLKAQQEAVSEEQSRLRDRWTELNREICTLENKIHSIEADNFRKECKIGLHKELRFWELPANVNWELAEIEKEISGGCKGDWEVGCRGCEHNCRQEAIEKFMKKYNIEKLTH